MNEWLGIYITPPPFMVVIMNSGYTVLSLDAVALSRYHRAVLMIVNRVADYSRDDTTGFRRMVVDALTKIPTRFTTIDHAVSVVARNDLYIRLLQIAIEKINSYGACCDELDRISQDAENILAVLVHYEQFGRLNAAPIRSRF